MTQGRQIIADINNLKQFTTVNISFKICSFTVVAVMMENRRPYSDCTVGRTRDDSLQWHGCTSAEVTSIVVVERRAEQVNRRACGAVEEMRVEFPDLVQILQVPHVEAVVVVEGGHDTVVLVVGERDAVGVVEARVVGGGGDVGGGEALGDVDAEVVGPRQHGEEVERGLEVD